MNERLRTKLAVALFIISVVIVFFIITFYGIWEHDRRSCDVLRSTMYSENNTHGYVEIYFTGDNKYNYQFDLTGLDRANIENYPVTANEVNNILFPIKEDFFNNFLGYHGTIEGVHDGKYSICYTVFSSITIHNNTNGGELSEKEKNMREFIKNLGIILAE